MVWTEFLKRYPDEESCKAAWKRYRDRVGVVCPHCGCTDHYWKSDKECYECKRCKYRQSLKSNTVMHGSQLPFRYWFMAIRMLTSTNKSISAKELQRQLGHKNYNPIWAMHHKLQEIMKKENSEYDLKGIIELDEGSLTTEEVSQEEKHKPRKRGRGRQRKTAVLVMAETGSGKNDNPKDGSKPTAVRHIR